MLNILEALFESLQAIIKFITSIVEAMLQAHLWLPSLISSVSGAVGYLPSVLAYFAYVSIALIVLKFVMGKVL